MHQLVFHMSQCCTVCCTIICQTIEAAILELSLVLHGYIIQLYHSRSEL